LADGLAEAEPVGVLDGKNDKLCVGASLAITDGVTDENEGAEVGCDESSALGNKDDKL
jgi:hypothetical protein